jgi:2-iminobutanoate/2-iminopropanoate deaminase
MKNMIIFALMCFLCAALSCAQPIGKSTISTENAPKAIGPYSQAVLSGDMLFVSGQLALDPQTGAFLSDSIESQTRQVLLNLGAVLKAAGMDYSNVVQCSVFLKDLDDFAKMNSIYGEFFKTSPPARATVQVTRLPKDARVEISLIAVR